MEVNKRRTAQQMAKNFIVLHDVLPLSVMNDEDIMMGNDTSFRSSTRLICARNN